MGLVWPVGMFCVSRTHWVLAPIPKVHSSRGTSFTL